MCSIFRHNIDGDVVFYDVGNYFNDVLRRKFLDTLMLFFVMLGKLNIFLYNDSGIRTRL